MPSSPVRLRRGRPLTVLLSFKLPIHVVMACAFRPASVLVTCLTTVSIVTPDQLHVNAVANTPVYEEEVRRARSDLEGPRVKSVFEFYVIR